MLTDLWSHLRASLVTASKREKREGVMGDGFWPCGRGRANWDVGFGQPLKWSPTRICTGPLKDTVEDGGVGG
ncbi:hypothetical protein ACFX2I_025353 [Malus domestica]